MLSQDYYIKNNKFFIATWVINFSFPVFKRNILPLHVGWKWLLLQNQICKKIVCWVAVLSVLSTFYEHILFCFCFFPEKVMLWLAIIIAGSFVALFCLILADSCFHVMKQKNFSHKKFSKFSLVVSFEAIFMTERKMDLR